MLDTLSHRDVEALLRLMTAVACGMLIGLNRDMRGKPTGMRTLGLVGLGSALVALTAIRVDGIEGHPDATSRVIQGIVQGVMTGIGFLGAGVVLHRPHKLRVHGLTTAATVWVTAALGVACALASWHLILLSLVVTLVLLVAVLPLDRYLDRRHAERDMPEDEPHPDADAGHVERPPVGPN